ncbi:MAG: DUF5723 family protein [Crocinitomicaceae bacterium]
MMTDNFVKGLFLVVLVIAGFSGNAQDKFGATHSNYSPTNSVHLNPSSMLDAKTWLDIHIVGAGSYVNNNFLAIEDNSWLNVAQQRQVDENQLLYNTNRNRYHFYNRNNVSALSAVLSQGDHAFGLSFNGYTYADARNINNAIAQPLAQYLNGQNVDDLSNLDVNNLRLNALSYGEVKLSYAYTFKKVFRELWMFGGSFKKIFPVAGGAAKVSEANYSILPNDLLAVGRFQGDVMFNQSPEFILLGGMGIDLGFTFQKMQERSSIYFPNSQKSGCKRNHYIYKIGISVLDLGSVKFKEATTQSYAVQVDSITVNPSSNIESILSSVTTGQEASGINKTNKMSLPTVLSLQLDFNVWNNMFYINGTLIQGIPPFSGSFGPRRANSLSITPRFETKWFDIAMPFSIYEYRQAQLGLSTRLYFLTIGTDKLLSIFVPSDLYGADIYAQIKVPLYKNPKCKDKSFNSKKSRKKRKKLCEAYW